MPRVLPQFLRSLRHRNIILFFGAGDLATSPFLVTEFLARGSLAGVLQDTDIALSRSRKVQFALDAACGIRFLHELRPARIHRDIKSANLLVAEVRPWPGWWGGGVEETAHAAR